MGHEQAVGHSAAVGDGLVGPASELVAVHKRVVGRLAAVHNFAADHKTLAEQRLAVVEQRIAVVQQHSVGTTLQVIKKGK